MSQSKPVFDVQTPVAIDMADPTPRVMILCEHAANVIPDGLASLGLDPAILASHVAWDPGALGVAQHLTHALSACLVHSTVSRLVYDCNRPPTATSAIPEQSEIYTIPGNQNLNPNQWNDRVTKVYAPFKAQVDTLLSNAAYPFEYLITIHSFTPVFHGQHRDVHIGILHGQDTRLATSMMVTAPTDTPYSIRLNEPYSATDGVAHSLDVYGLTYDLPSVMIEIRNDLIETGEAQREMATLLAGWITLAVSHMAKGQVQSGQGVA